MSEVAVFCFAFQLGDSLERTFFAKSGQDTKNLNSLQNTMNW